MTRVERIRAALEAAFAPSRLEVEDDSHRHAGHAGARDGRGHFNVSIVSEAFAGKPPLARHRAVYAALGEMIQTDIHALAIKAQTPAEALTADRAAGPADAKLRDAYLALVSLGYKPADAQRMVKDVAVQIAPDSSLEDVLRKVLSGRK